MNKYEQLIEHIINDNEQAARALFHQIVVEKSRDIYESLMDEEMGGNPTTQFVNDITQDVQGDEQGLSEEGDDDLDIGDDDLDVDSDDMDDDSEFDFDKDGEIDDHEEEHGEVEDRVQDLEDELESLKAEFDRLVAGEEAEEENFPGIHGDAGVSDEEEEEGEEMMEISGMSGSGKSGSGMMEASGKSGSGKSDSGKSGSGMSGSGKSGSGKSSSEIMKEYVDKVKDFYKGDNAEGSLVGTDGSVPVNKSSTVAGKNDMGGTTANIAKGNKGENPDGTAPKKASNYGTKGQGNLPHAGQYQNVPGAKAKAEKTGTSYEKSRAGEGKLVGDDGSISVNAKSEIGGKVR